MLSRRSPWDLVILDRRATSVDDFRSWERFAPVVAIDEGGPAREMVQYLIDILPPAPSFRRGGSQLLGYRPPDLPRARRAPPKEFRRVLVSFGGEDSAGLGLGLARLLLAEGFVEPADLTVVSGALRRGAPPLGLEGAAILGPVQDLKEHLSRYDLVFTQFGLTAFEAAWAGCGVVLLESQPLPSRAFARGRLPGDRRAPARIDWRSDVTFARRPRCSRLGASFSEDSQSLADRVAGLIPAGTRDCPSCSSSGPSGSVPRSREELFPLRGLRDRLYAAVLSGQRESLQAGVLLRGVPTPIRQDLPGGLACPDRACRFAARRHRGDRAASLGRSTGLSLLDVGCAYGPFLAAAKARGQEPFGLDAAEEAVAYVRSELGLPAASGDFLDPAAAATFGGPFDVISMWYVIEHFESVDKALRNAAALLRPGGILAFRLPPSKVPRADSTARPSSSGAPRTTSPFGSLQGRVLC